MDRSSNSRKNTASLSGGTRFSVFVIAVGKNNCGLNYPNESKEDVPMKNIIKYSTRNRNVFNPSHIWILSFVKLDIIFVLRLWKAPDLSQITAQFSEQCTYLIGQIKSRKQLEMFRCMYSVELATECSIRMTEMRWAICNSCMMQIAFGRATVPKDVKDANDARV